MKKRHKNSATAKPTKPGISVRPLVVGTTEARRLGGWGKTKIFELIAAGELDSYLEGRVRRVTLASIEARIARKLQEAKANPASA